MLASALCLHFISQAFKIDVAYRMMYYRRTFLSDEWCARDSMYAEVIWRHAKNAREEIVEEALACRARVLMNAWSSLRDAFEPHVMFTATTTTTCAAHVHMILLHFIILMNS